MRCHALRPVPPLDRDLSRIVLGSTRFTPERYDDAAAILDTWLELGGNVIDTAENYGRGAGEAVIGRWLRESGRRDEVVIVTKAGHPYDRRSRLGAADLRADLDGSFEHLGTDAIDVWLLHRDDDARPVGGMDDAPRPHPRCRPGYPTNEIGESPALTPNPIGHDTPVE